LGPVERQPLEGSRLSGVQVGSRLVKYVAIESTVYFHFVVSDATGTAVDGTGAAFAVRKAGAASSAAPTLTGTPSLLSHTSFPDGCYEIAVAATAVNGFVDGSEYAVFCSLSVSSVNPAGYVGSFLLGCVRSNV